MSYGNDIADVLGQVVEIGHSPAETELGAAVSRHVSNRRPAPASPGDSETVAALRARPTLGLASTAELLDELRARLDVAGLLDYRTLGGNP